MTPQKIWDGRTGMSVRERVSVCEYVCVSMCVSGSVCERVCVFVYL